MNKAGIELNKNNELIERLEDIIKFKQSGNDKNRNERVTTKESLDDLSNLTKQTLLEMLDRQTKLLKNRLALEKLPDRGAKIKQSKKRIEDELERRFSTSTNLCDDLACLNLSASQVNALEWSKNVQHVKQTNNEVNEYDDSNPFRIIATHSGTAYSKKIINRVEIEDKPLITDQDIEEIYAMRLCNKIDQIEPEKKFLPHKSLNHEFRSKKLSREYKPQDLCAALQPPSKYGNVKPISLEASIMLQYEQGKLLKDVQLKHAAERLKEKTYKIGSELPSYEKLKVYREQNLLNSDDSGEEEDDAGSDELEEVHDECIDEDREGTVTFQMND